MSLQLAIRRCVVVAFILFGPAVGSALAQTATLAGKVSDESQAVLPGTTITAKDVATGRTFVAVAEGNGEYRLPAVPPGRYTIQAELSGFATAITPEIELLVGQNATLNFNMKVATLNETVTVLAEAPLVDTQSATVSGNIDRRQMEALPLNGRNWMELTMMVKGVTQNAITHMPTAKEQYFQLNVDGQEITQSDCCSLSLGQPRMSREALAEYQVSTNMFDISAGRSLGLQVNAVTKSGTNQHQGAVFGFIRHDSLNAKDFIANRVLPYSNQQIGGSVGGPIITNRLHYFGVTEYEREPATLVFAPAVLAPQTLTLPTKTTTTHYFLRGDFQAGTKDRFSARFMKFRRFNPFSPETTRPPVAPNQLSQFLQAGHSNVFEWSRVMSNTRLQQVTIGETLYRYEHDYIEGGPHTPRLSFPGFSWGPVAYMPIWETTGAPISAKYQLSWQKGEHALKIGGEFIHGLNLGNDNLTQGGTIQFSALPPDIGRRLPIDSWNDPTRWDFSGIDSLALRYDVTLYKDPSFTDIIDIPREVFAVWLGDTWRVSNKLTLNLGVRYDLGWNDFNPPNLLESDIPINNGKFTENVGHVNGMQDVNNVAPRVGFAWTPTDGSLVIRGGSGIFYGTNSSGETLYVQESGQELTLSIVNDGRPGFILDPTRGATAEDYLAGRVPLPPQNPHLLARRQRQPHSWQSMFGFQKQIGPLTAFDADLVVQNEYNSRGTRDPNLFYDPATGFNKNPNVFGRPNPAYSQLRLHETDRSAKYFAMVSSLTRRYNARFQTGATYTLMFFKEDNGTEGSTNNPFDRDADWGRSGDFQRHTVRVNGTYLLPWDFSLAGIMRYGSGNYRQINPGVNVLFNAGANRTRRDLTVIPKNTFHDDSHFTTDLRVTKLIQAGGLRLEAIAEVFNVFNRARYGRNVIETSPTFGRPQTADPPRQGQLAFRVSF